MKLSQRDRFEKRLKRLRPDNVDIVIPRVDFVVEKLISVGFSMEIYSVSELPFWSNELWFERPHSKQAFEYIEIGFADDGSLSFGLSCGARDYHDPDIWHLYATLSKRRFGLWRTLDLGDLVLSPFQRQTFIRDWTILTESIDGIVHFLETGIPCVGLNNVIIFDPFVPKGQ
jgi:hypothetical protein